MSIKKVSLSPKHKEPIDSARLNWEDEDDIPKIKITRYCTKPAESVVVSVSPKFCENSNHIDDITSQRTTA